jgi:hypothetical protein
MAPATRIVVESGTRYGNLLTIEEVRIQSRARTVRGVLCLCDCGKLTAVRLHQLVYGRTNSCGCGVVVAVRARNLTHGLRHHPLYLTWHAMRYRCESPKSPSYRWYGAKGVQVCERWKDLSVFIADIDALLGPRPDGHTLDRVDSSGNYEPNNVRWADALTQTLNRGSSHASR